MPTPPKRKPYQWIAEAVKPVAAKPTKAVVTVLDQWKALAKIENKRMIEQHGGRPPKYGVVDKNQKGTGKPRYSEIERSKPAQEILRLSEQGFTVAEVARFTAVSVEEVLRKAARYQIKFRGGSSWVNSK